MEVIYLYCAFSYLWMFGFMSIEWAGRKEKAGMISVFVLSPITFPLLSGIKSG